jgi:hypothetical protein
MNERIQELVKQSGGDFWQRLENDAVKENAYITFDPPESLEKFVELIVKETLEVARAGVEFGDGMESAVEQYFGVKL